MVLLLIAAIAAFSIWWPRRTTWALLRVDADIHDQPTFERLNEIGNGLPDAAQPIWEWLTESDEWLYRDANLQFVSLVNSSVDDRWLFRLKRCNNLKDLWLDQRQVGPGLARLDTLQCLDSLNIGEATHETSFGLLQALPHVEFLRVYFRDDSPTQPLNGWESLARHPAIRRIHAYLKGNDLEQRLRLVTDNLRIDHMRVEGSINNDVLKHLGTLSSVTSIQIQDLDDYRNVTLDGWKELQRLKRLHLLDLKQRDKSQASDQLIEAIKPLFPDVEFDPFLRGRIPEGLRNRSVEQPLQPQPDENQ